MCLIFFPWKPSLHHPPPGLTLTPCLCLPPQAPCKLHPCISFSPAQPWKVSMPSFLSRLSNQSGVQLDTELYCAVLKVLLLLLDFAHCLATMFEIEMLAPPQLRYYTNQVEICWSKLPCASTGLGFQPSVSLKYIFQHWILASCAAGEVSPWVRSLAASNPHILLCFLCFRNHILTMNWSTKMTFGLQPVSCSESLTQSVALDFSEDTVHGAIPHQSNV